MLETSNPTLESFNYQVLDVRKGLGVWGDSEAFRRALKKMGQDYGDVATRVEVLCRESQWQAAKELLHAFKGVAGNLGVRELPEAANAIETEIKAGRPVSQQLIDDLAAKTSQLRQDLSQIETLTGCTAPAGAELDKDIVLPLLTRLIEELGTDEMNDDTIEPLRSKLGAVRFEPIEIQLESFEFRRAVKAAQDLLDALLLEDSRGEPL